MVTDSVPLKGTSLLKLSKSDAFAPGGPIGPTAPARPAPPGGPVRPLDPVGPRSPVLPLGPLGPLWVLATVAFTVLAPAVVTTSIRLATASSEIAARSIEIFLMGADCLLRGLPGPAIVFMSRSPCR